MFAPYVQVMRMQVVIIAFGAVHAARRESFLVFALIYALYFFPWRLVRERTMSGAVPGTLSETPVRPAAPP